MSAVEVMLSFVRTASDTAGHGWEFSSSIGNIASIGGLDLLVFDRPGIQNKTPSPVENS